jgi:hypothetical protein
LAFYFNLRRYSKALLLHYNSPGAAMEWLLEVTDAEADSGLTDQQVRLRYSLSARSVSRCSPLPFPLVLLLRRRFSLFAHSVPLCPHRWC